MSVEQRGKVWRQRENAACLNLFLLETMLFALHVKPRSLSKEPVTY